MSPSFQCVSGVSNKYNLGKLYFDEREKVKKKKQNTWFTFSSNVQTDKGKKVYVSHILHAALRNNRSDRLT